LSDEGHGQLVGDVFMQWHGGSATISSGDAVFDRYSSCRLEAWFLEIVGN
jgi:hypothetical protein